MQFKPHERVMLFIDGASTHKISEGLGFQIDYAKLLQHIDAKAHLIRAYYYTMIKVDVDDRGNEVVGLQPLLDYLEYNGFTLVTKDMREGPDTAQYENKVRLRGNIMVELTCDLMRLHTCYDHAVMFTGDGNYAYVVKMIQDMGKRVTVISTMRTKPAAIADELKRQADRFVDLDSMKSSIERVRNK